MASAVPRYTEGPRGLHSRYWNSLWRLGLAHYALMIGDDKLPLKSSASDNTVQCSSQDVLVWAAERAACKHTSNEMHVRCTKGCMVWHKAISPSGVAWKTDRHELENLRLYYLGGMAWKMNCVLLRTLQPSHLSSICRSSRYQKQ